HRKASLSSSTFSCRSRQASATPDIVPPLRAPRPWRLPDPWRYFLVYVLFWTPARPDRNKDFCDRLGFPLNNRGRCIRRFSCHDPRRPAPHRSVPFHSATIISQHSFPALLPLSPIQYSHGVSRFFQSAFSMF